jgi:cell division protein FtsW (lipid II flippase)
MTLDTFGLFICIAGFVIGLGAVTVIDIHGLLGRTSAYWTEATTRTHKVTKPLIWIGIALVIIGSMMIYRNESFSGIPLYHAVIFGVLIVNGLFLSFYVSPFLLNREKQGKQADLLPRTLQNKIVVSFIISDLGWWGGLFLLAVYLTQ